MRGPRYFWKGPRGIRSPSAYHEALRLAADKIGSRMREEYK